MKIKILVSLLLVFLFALPVLAAPPKGKSASLSQRVDNTTYIDANRILMFVTNHGNFGRDLAGTFGYDYGTWFPYTGDTADIQNDVKEAGQHSPYYAGGLWVGAVVDGETRVIVSEYSDEYVPGPMENGTFMEDRPAFKVYKLYRDSLENNPNEDYLNWPVDQGAPVDSLGNPDMIGDQMLWSVFNDADPDQHINNSGLTDPLGLEVRQTTFAFDRQGSLGNVVVLRMRVYNKGANTLEDCYFSIWSDPDLGSAGDDFVGCDTTLGLGYVYNDGNEDPQYANMPIPCLGIDFFQGPLVEGDPDDTAFMWGDTILGFTNLGMTSFNKYINGTDPDNAGETYSYMTGFNRDGSVYIYDGQELKYVATGDPVAGTGDLDIASADRRWMQSTGPITFAPGDSTEILAAIVVGQGANQLNSITVMKELDNFAQKLYESGFNPPRPPAPPVVKKTEVQNRIVLTWGDTSEIDPGDFFFEGYTVWQGETKAGPWTELVTYDVINEFDKALVDTITDAASGLKIPDIKRVVGNTGMAYNYTTTVDAINGGELNDVTDYFYRVTAFSFSYLDYRDDPPSNVPNGDRFLESQTVLTATPQAPVAGEHSGASALDTLSVVHVGGSDGIVLPMVTDPMAFLGDDYRIDFGTDTVAAFHDDVEFDTHFTYDELLDTCDVDWDFDSILVTFCVDTIVDSVDTFDFSYWDTTFNTFWNLTNTTLDEVYVEKNFNISGDDNYQIFDGMQILVSGPPLEGNSYSYASSDPVNISPVTMTEHPEYVQERVDYTGRWFSGEGSGELLFGGVYLGPNFTGSNLGAADYKPVEIRWRPMTSYTDLNGDGSFTTGEPYFWEAGPNEQSAFMYSTWGSGNFTGFHPIPFSAWDVTDPENPRQLNVVIRDRDQNDQWDWHAVADPPDPLLPNDGSQAWNYVWIMDDDYDPTGAAYDPGLGGIDFMGVEPDYPCLWTMWLNSRGVGSFLAEEGMLTLVPNYVITPADVFTFTNPPPSFTSSESDLGQIRAVPNPFYLFGSYDPSPGSYAIRFHHLPDECEISIFNLAGDLVRTIQKERSDALAEWDVLSEQGLPVASGIYIYVVEAPGFGTKTGKLAVFVEQEVLRIY